MILKIEVGSTKSFSLDRKSSYSMSLMSWWLPRGICVGAIDSCEFWNDLLSSERGEQFLHDIVLVQFGPDILESNITKSSQSDLGKTSLVFTLPRNGAGAGRTLFARQYIDLGEHGLAMVRLGGRELGLPPSCEGFASSAQWQFWIPLRGIPWESMGANVTWPVYT